MVVSVLALTGLRVIVPILLGNAVTDILAKEPLNSILIISLEIIVVSAVSSVFQFGLGYGGQILGQKIIYDMRNDIFVALQKQSFSFHDKNETGQLMSRATGDVEAVRRLLAFGSGQILGNAFLIAGVVVSLFFLNLQFALVSIVVFPLVIYISWKYSETQGPHWKKSREHYGAINSVLQQNITGMRIVRSFSAEQGEIKKFEKPNEAYRDDIVNAAAIRAFYSPLLTLLVNLNIGLLFLFGGSQIIGGTLVVGDLGNLVAAANLLALLVNPVRSLGQLILIYQNGMAGFDRILEITDAAIEIKDRPNAIELDTSKAAGRISFENVKFGYGGGERKRLILDGIDLKIEPGEIVALLGATGSGKTTLANLVPRFYDVTSGSVRFDGIDVRDIKLRSLRSNIGIVSQDIFLFSATIKENIAYGKQSASLEDTQSASRIANADEFIERFPEKYDTLVGERGVTLSGGQKQRIAIARTILTDPKVLILDDSLSSVDVETEQTIQDALRAVVKERTTLIISQRLSTIRLASRIIVFDEGRIAEEGTHNELLRLNGLYSELYNTQLAPQDLSVESNELLAAQKVRSVRKGSQNEGRVE